MAILNSFIKLFLNKVAVRKHILSILIYLLHIKEHHLSIICNNGLRKNEINLSI
jgi:hypothetical protein